MFFSIPVLTAVITFLVFTALGNKMDASLIFSSMALLVRGHATSQSLSCAASSLNRPASTESDPRVLPKDAGGGGFNHTSAGRTEADWKVPVRATDTSTSFSASRRGYSFTRQCFSSAFHQLTSRGTCRAAEELAVPAEDVRTASTPPGGFGSVLLRGVSVQVRGSTVSHFFRSVF